MEAHPRVGAYLMATILMATIAAVGAIISNNPCMPVVRVILCPDAHAETVVVEDDFGEDDSETGSIAEAASSSASSTGAAAGGSQEPVAISMYSSDTKEDWLDTVTKRFHEAGYTTSSGRPIEVNLEHVKSGSSQQAILNGQIQPVIWSPGDYSWVDGLNDTWTGRTGSPLIPDECHATVYAPVGFAVWRPMAEAMGWPHEPIGWDDMVELAADPEGWGRYGHPEWGQFKFGHTHPDYSNSGLLLMSALVYSTLDRTDELTAELVKSEEVVEAMRAVELNTHHYGSSSRYNTTSMVNRGPNYLHATNATESETLRTNSGVYGNPRFPLAFIFPAEGTFWAEQPFCVLEADWVSEEQAEAARIYSEFLMAPEQQALTVENFVRPVDASIPLAEPFTLANGTDPTVTRERVPVLESLSAEASGAVKDVFHDTKKKATIVIVLDTSSSMQGHKMKRAASATADFIDQLDRGDRIYAYTFNDTVNELSPSGPVGQVKERLEQTVETLWAAGNTALYDAVCTSVERMLELEAEDDAAGDERLYGIILLSDGEDTVSEKTENDMKRCIPTGEDVWSPKIYTIAYGVDADENLLTEIANRSGGKYSAADPATISEIIRRMLAEQ